MKYIVFGLGNFGAALSVKLQQLGNEVVGADKSMEKVEAMKDLITHAICLDSTDADAVGILPLHDADAVVVAIGEDVGASIMTTALMKQMKVKRLIGRAISPLQETVLEAMGVEEIIHPEEEAADRLSKKLNMRGVVDSFFLDNNYNIVEAIVPKRYEGSTIGTINLRLKYNITVLTLLKSREQKNAIGISRKITSTVGVATADTKLEQGDIMVLFGHIKDITRLLQE